MKLENIILGRTTVKVMKKEINDATGRETISELHRGVIVQNLGKFLRIFNPDSKDKGGDCDPLYSELFPIESRRSWIEQIGELKENQAVRIPVQFI